MNATSTNTAPSGRLESLDILRGFDMFFITGGGALLAALGTLCWGEGNWLAVQMTHVAWDGLRFEDVVFPLFLFITGVTFPFSTARRLERGDSRADVAWNILRRALTLVLLGALYEGVQRFDWAHFRVWSVIGRIGLVWGTAAFLTLSCRLRTCLAVTVAVLVGWWALLRFVPSPEAAPGAYPLLGHANCIACWFDAQYLTTARRFEGGLATVAMLPTAFFGIWAGMFLRSARFAPAAKPPIMLGVAAAMLALGWACSFGKYGFPVIKDIWSGTFALVTGGISLALLAVFHWAVDIRGWKRWGFYFKVIGVNAITIYFAQKFVPFDAIGRFFLGTLDNCSTAAGWTEFVTALCRCAAGWTMLYMLYRRKVFFKI